MKPTRAIQTVQHAEPNPAYNSRDCKSKMWIQRIELREVIVLAIVGPHAMVRRPKFLPYVCQKKDLQLSPETKNENET